MQQAQPIDYKEAYEGLLLKYEGLVHDFARLKKMVFSSKSERFVPTDTDGANPQLTLALEAETIAQCKITDKTEISYTRTRTEVIPNPPKAHPGRMKLPEHLRREVILLLPQTNTEGLKKIGEDITEVLDFIPAELFVKQYIRPKYVQPLSDVTSTVITASLPGRIMEKCMAGEALLAQITVDKYVDHIPLHRQMQCFLRAGLNIAQSTINDWVKVVLTHMATLYNAHKKILLACGYLHVDETPIKVLDESKKGTTHQGYYWVYHNSKDKLVLFDYRKGRGREGPDDILKDYQGFLQADGYNAYDDFDKRAGITLIHCMAHARRKFSEALAK